MMRSSTECRLTWVCWMFWGLMVSASHLPRCRWKLGAALNDGAICTILPSHLCHGPSVTLSFRAWQHVIYNTNIIHILDPKTWSVFHSWRASTTFWPILHVHKKSVPPTSFEIRIWILNNTSTSPLNQSNQSTKNEIKSSKYSNNFKFLNYVKLDGNAVLEKFLRIIIASSLIFYGKS